MDNPASKRKNTHAVALGRKGGKAGKGKTSEAQASASRENGKKGGRPLLMPDDVMDELKRIASEHGGVLTPADLVRAAKAEDSILHPFFGQKDGAARARRFLKAEKPIDIGSGIMTLTKS